MCVMRVRDACACYVVRVRVMRGAWCVVRGAWCVVRARSRARVPVPCVVCGAWYACLLTWLLHVIPAASDLIPSMPRLVPLGMSPRLRTCAGCSTALQLLGATSRHGCGALSLAHNVFLRFNTFSISWFRFSGVFSYKKNTHTLANGVW